MTGIVNERQSILDVAMQYLGSDEGCFFVAEALNIAITDVPTVGSSFEYEKADIIDLHVANYYSENNIIPVTEI